ncbi:10246_t:CDS:2 [Funneliformis caledonium]|uniref:10246_t:CDS:1 n=1 Tax=Funneliformis caledonium TaxID=1117310 RepID=A0A9N8V5T2_9GLOM|nr:10246_t:CDS:2 [Funneliformis caledonium]
MNFEICELTPAGRIKRPSYAIAEWVKKLWVGVNISLIQKSFKCCRISVARNESEDNLMFDYDSLLNNTKKKKSGQNKVQNIDDFSSDSDDDFYRDSNSSDKKEVLDYENEY